MQRNVNFTSASMCLSVIMKRISIRMSQAHLQVGNLISSGKSFEVDPIDTLNL